jgi:hypothetical protein
VEPFQYQPRDPNDCVVQQVLRRHLDEFLARVREEADRELPAFVVHQLRALSTCGDFTHGFIRLRCDRCQDVRILPFSCKGRICPSCAGRRMSDTAAWLTDRVLDPNVAYRQWVFTVPPPLAVALCFRSGLASTIVRMCVDELFRFFRGHSPEPDAFTHPGCIVWLQRFSDAAGAWFHLHVLAPDGCWLSSEMDMALRFHPAPPPSLAELNSMLRRLAQRVTRHLHRTQELDVDHPLLPRLGQQPAQRRGHAKPAPGRPRKPRLLAEYEGFSIHAATMVRARDPQSLERLLRYLSRPPLHTSRVERLMDGRVAFKLKRPRRTATEFVFEPLAFIARLAALIPRPMENQVRYFGVYSPASPDRKAILPKPPQISPSRPLAPERPKRMAHADLLKRVFVLDIKQCPCGGRLQLIDAVPRPDIFQAMGAAMVLTTQQPARGPPGAPT